MEFFRVKAEVFDVFGNSRITKIFNIYPGDNPKARIDKMIVSPMEYVKTKIKTVKINPLGAIYSTYR